MYSLESTSLSLVLSKEYIALDTVWYVLVLLHSTQPADHELLGPDGSGVYKIGVMFQSLHVPALYWPKYQTHHQSGRRHN